MVLGVFGYGCGALVERAAALRLPLSVRLPCGTALMLAVIDLLTRSTSTVGAAIPAVCALAAAGILLRLPWPTTWTVPWRAHAGWAGWRPLDRTAIAPLLVYAIYAAPIVLSGAATWAGYVKLDDTATWLALVDRTLSAGHSLAGLPPSTYTDTLASYLTGGYPVGSFLPLGLGHALLGQDIAWLTDPWMAFMAAMLAFSLQRIARSALAIAVAGPAATRTCHAATAVSHANTIEHTPRAPHSVRERGLLAGAAAMLGAVAALLYGYYLWGGMKEMAAAMLIAAFASTAPLAFEGSGDGSADPDDSRRARAVLPARALDPARAVLPVHAVDPARAIAWVRAVDSARPIDRLRAAIPALVVLWAILAALSSGGLIWIVPGGAIAFVLLVLLSGTRLPPTRTLARAGAALALVCGACAYLALRPGGFYQRNKSVLTGGDELGNLIAPLHLRQIVGIWTSGDFRLAPDSALATDALIVLATLAAAGALIAALRRGRRELALYVLCSLVGALIVFSVASPWLGGKALASASPAIAFAALLGCSMALTTWTGWRRALAALAGLAIATGIVWSDLLGYHDVSLAPHAQFAELAQIGERIAGQGPTLMTDYSPYGARHFLREAEAESASELRTRPDLLISGQPLAKATTADIDQFELRELLIYRTLVLRRSPVASRPPSPYRLVLRDRYWDVWQRPASVKPPVLAQLPLGDPVKPGAAPVCSQVRKLARTPGATRLAAVAASNPRIVALGEASHPLAWSAQGEHLTLAGAGTARIEVSVPRPGRYAVWLGGSISGPVTLAVNGGALGADGGTLGANGGALGTDGGALGADGGALGTARYEIQEDAQYVPFGSIDLQAGHYELSVSYDGGDWRPGSGGPPATVGPLVLAREEPEHPPFAVPLNSARTLCGRTLDWVEALGR